MLKNIDPLLTPDLLHALAAMGHGDCIAVCDTNFPAYSIAGDRPLIHLPGCNLAQALRAILSVLPLDTYDTPVLRMAQVGDASTLSDAQREAVETVFSRLDPQPRVEALERFAYYEQAKQAYAVVQTGDARPYGNFILRKGVLN
ncbi:fucose-binding protein [Ramlibacter sp. G-1-2-2]|uniref:Fucose-binding protein n=1 Tax=Ramlibacter agri TaxID=2728837 RepID=A0A848H6F8_9BURK|nr:RbsD/FucU domain-containing protein [Ramlibacter agri]NML45101.1 fucose-binding protein [Ramlibacter agri]